MERINIAILFIKYDLTKFYVAVNYILDLFLEIGAKAFGILENNTYF